MNDFRPKIIRFNSLPSTNTEAARRAQQGAEEGLTIVAGEQTYGRGRLKRRWLSPAGAGLYASIVLRPGLDHASWSLIPLMAALAVHDALVDAYALDVDIKWPNDILLAERKLCGILAETVETNSGRAVVVGIGINLTTEAFPAELREVATSIQEATGQAPDSDGVLQFLLRALADRYALFQAGDAQRIIHDWAKRSTYAQGKSVFVTSGDDSFSGITRGLESDGALRVETVAGEIKVVRAGDVTSVRQTSSVWPEPAERAKA